MISFYSLRADEALVSKVTDNGMWISEENI